MQHQELVLGDEVLAALCVVVRLLDVFDVCRAAADHPGMSAHLWLLFIPAALSWLLQILVLAMVSIHSEVSPGYALTAPLGLGLLYAMLFDSSIRITTGIGVRWKGRKIYERRGIRPPRFRTDAPRVSNIEE